jgi:16S rRNA (guanine1207-N2)-methyltransferase
MQTRAGIFSGDRLDKGTAVLLDAYEHNKLQLPHAPQHDILDIGCGAGPLTMVLANQFSASAVWGIDVNERAVEMCSANAKMNTFENIRCCSPGHVPPATRFSVIWSNPPIRIGKEQLHILLSTWLSRLAPDGIAHFVVGKNLGGDSLATWITSLGFHVTRAASSKGFRVLEISNEQGQGRPE